MVYFCIIVHIITIAVIIFYIVNVKSKLIFTVFFPKLWCITTNVENLRVQIHPSLRLILDIVIFIAVSANTLFFIWFLYWVDE